MSTINRTHDSDYFLDSEDGLTSIPDEVAQMFTLLCYIIMSPIFSVFGIEANLINMIIEYSLPTCVVLQDDLLITVYISVER
nr:hypothetical protein BgiMline_010336 [Biomphalaria glabrata]